MKINIRSCILILCLTISAVIGFSQNKTGSTEFNSAGIEVLQPGCQNVLFKEIYFPDWDSETELATMLPKTRSEFSSVKIQFNQLTMFF